MTLQQKIESYIDQHADEAISFLQKLIQQPSVQGNEKGVQELVVFEAPPAEKQGMLHRFGAAHFAVRVGVQGGDQFFEILAARLFQRAPGIRQIDPQIDRAVRQEQQHIMLPLFVGDLGFCLRREPHA